MTEKDIEQLREAFGSTLANLKLRKPISQSEWSDISKLFVSLGDYCAKTTERGISYVLILYINQVLDDLKANIKDEFITRELYTYIFETLEVFYTIRDSIPNEEIYFKDIKVLGRRLSRIGRIIINTLGVEARLAGDSSTDAPPPKRKKNKRHKK